MQPLPLEVIRAQFLTVKPRTYVCCVCHAQPIANVRTCLCEDKACRQEARRLDWVLS